MVHYFVGLVTKVVYYFVGLLFCWFIILLVHYFVGLLFTGHIVEVKKEFPLRWRKKISEKFSDFGKKKFSDFKGEKNFPKIFFLLWEKKFFLKNFPTLGKNFFRKIFDLGKKFFSKNFPDFRKKNFRKFFRLGVKNNELLWSLNQQNNEPTK